MGKIYVGLDVGSNSVGWCATNENYDVLRLRGKDAIGATIFSEASDAKARRAFRTNKRRINRRKYRIYLLNTLFAEEITKIDRDFFIRLSNSTLAFEDKSSVVSSCNTLFGNKSLEKNYYKKYPTIWHLREAMVKNSSDAFTDIRYLYLALHHIIKYRGNFLKEGELNANSTNVTGEDLKNVNDAIKNLYELYSGEEYEENIIDASKYEAIISILYDKSKNKIEKSRELKPLFNSEGVEKYVTLFSNLIIGKKASLKDFGTDSDSEIKDIVFDDSFDEKVDSYRNILQDAYQIVELAKNIYDVVILHDLLKDSPYISNAMVRTYDRYKLQLKALKNLIISIDRAKNDCTYSLYNMIFKNDNIENNYSFLSTHGGNKILLDFYKYIQKIFEDNKTYINEDAVLSRLEGVSYTYKDILKDIETGVFLKTIALTSTSVFPHQLHLKELKEILENATKYYPFINDLKDKIIKLFLYRIPYYYGPLNTRSDKSSVVRKQNVTITPWNIDDPNIIDESASRAKFINKLINNCQYLRGYKVLPKSSLLYEEYLLLDKLNTLTVNDVKLSYEEKKQVYDYLAKKSKTTIKDVTKFIASIKGIQIGDVLIKNVTGTDSFEAPTHASLQKVFDLQEQRDLVENLIRLATIYSDNKSDLKKVLRTDYPNLTANQIKAIATLGTKKWAFISREFLEELSYVDDAGIVHSIINIMREESENFNHIMHNPVYNFEKIIKVFNEKTSGRFSDKELVDEILENTPAMFRKSICKTLHILDDIKKASKKDPDRVFIEVTRSTLDKGKMSKEERMSKSRKDKIISFLNSLSKDGDNEIKNRVNEILKEVDALEEVKLKSKHVYLYFMQLGYNVYTGEKIDLEKVLNSETYDIDHIVPKSLRYDDSIDNTVLVDRETNQKIKKDLYPLPESLYTEKNIKLWKMLNRNKEMMSDIKLAALMRRSEMTLDEIEDFINRQINVVNYSNVAIRDVINILYKNTTVIFSKAKFASYLRDEYNIHKHRGINDTHHGVDAFLNIVAGNILYDYFSSFRRIYETEHKFINSYMEAVLYLKTAEMKSKIVDTANKHNIIVTYGLSYVDSEFYKQTIYGANNKEGKTKLIPIHTKDNSPFNNIKLYGGYDQLTTSCLYWVSYNLKGKRYKELVAIKLLYEKLFAKDESSLIKTISETCFKKKVENLQILRKIQINQKIKVFNGVFCLCTKGDSLNLKNAYQTYFDFDILYYINKGLKVLPSDNEESLISYKSGRKEKEIIFSKDKNKAIFELAVNKTHEKQYSEISYLQNYQNISVQRFMQYTVREQIEILNEMLVGFSYNARASKLQSKFKIGGECICIKSFKTIDDNVLLIRESVTGLYCKVEKI